VASVTLPLDLRGRSSFFAPLAAAPCAVLFGYLLPDSGPGVALRLAGAAACFLLVPGALVLRALGWSATPAVAVAGTVSVSLVIAALGLTVVFVAGTSILLAAVVIAVLSACALPFALRKDRPLASLGPERWPLAGVLALSVVYAGVLWWAAGPLKSDGFFHAARETKLAEFGSLSSLSTVDEFKDGGVHPGYIFPLWHAVVALISRASGVDVITTSLYLPAVLVPLAFVVVYALGTVVFRSPLGGAALVVVQLAQLGLVAAETNPAGTGYYENLSWPRGIAFLFLAPAVLALAFSFIVEGDWRYLVPLVCASFALTAIHLTYTPFVLLVIGAFMLARILVVRGWEQLDTRAAVTLASALAPFILFLPLVIPVARGSSDVSPSATKRQTELEHFHGIFTTAGRWVAMSLDAIAHGGPIVAAGFLAIPFAAFAARRLWSSLVLGASVGILAIVLTPPLFTALSDFLSVSQTRRLPLFLPLAVAIVGMASVLSRFRVGGVVAAGAAGTVLTILFDVDEPRYAGPGWVVVVGLAGGVLALVFAVVFASRGPEIGVWALASTTALVIPVALAVLPGLAAGSTASQLTPGVIAAVREDVPLGAVVFSDPKTNFELAAYAPVYITSSPAGYVAPTRKNHVQARVKDAKAFLEEGSLSDAERTAILRRWGAGWVLVDKAEPYPRDFLSQLKLVYQDGRYALYRVAG
jgi:hypothetical protein